MIKTTLKDEKPFDHKTDCLVIHCSETPDGILKEIDSRLKGAITQAYKDKRFEGKLNQTLLLNARGMLKADNVLLAGVGKTNELSGDKVSQASGTAAKIAEKACFKKISCLLQEKELAFSAQEKSADLAHAVIEGMCLALYHFDIYKSKPEENGSRVKEIVLLAPKTRMAAVRHAVDEARIIAEAVWMSRDLTVHPSNKATPTYLAKAASDMAKKYGVACKVLDAAEMKKQGMGLLLGVARGSHEPAKLIVLEYFGGKKNQPPVVIVGKGITFDTGGISLKPGLGMDEMKMDMSGGAVTIGAMQAVAGLKLPVNVVGLVPAAENMPGGSAIKPGDILTSLSGKTVEVLNTDAEGRLVLADALTYAIRQYNPKAIIDLATLTGACIIALGHHAAAVLGNNPDLIEKLKQSGTATGERVWELPLWEEYEKSMKSDVADLKNISGPNVGAGTITGAAFLKAFVEDRPWAHLDIAGTAWTGEEKPYVPKGPAGFGVRLLLHCLKNNF